ncbi:MAG TPA: hypothetical protein V6D26_08635 [Stenomitos sp.]
MKPQFDSETKPKQYTFTSSQGEVYHFQEGEFKLHSFDEVHYEYVLVRHKHGWFSASILEVFEAYTGIKLEAETEFYPEDLEWDINSPDWDYLEWTEWDISKVEFQATWEQFSERERNLILSDFYAWQAAN